MQQTITTIAIRMIAEIVYIRHLNVMRTWSAHHSSGTGQPKTSV